MISPLKTAALLTIAGTVGSMALAWQHRPRVDPARECQGTMRMLAGALEMYSLDN